MTRKKNAIVGIAAGSVLTIGVGLGVSTTAFADPAAAPATAPKAAATASPTSSSASAAAASTSSKSASNKPTSDSSQTDEAKLMKMFNSAKEDASKRIATKLGVSQRKVESAVNKLPDDLLPLAMQTRMSGNLPQPKAVESAVVKSMSTNLGVPEAKVKSALDGVYKDAKKEATTKADAEVTKRLSSSVKDGTLTQAESDAVQKAIDKGVFSPKKK